MKKIILLELCLIIMATAFQGDNPPTGWYIQPIPVNKNIVDIYFTDTLNGWAVTDWNPSYDTGYVLNTTNGGVNWLVNSSKHIDFTAIQFKNTNLGYFCGGDGSGVIYKTSNRGANWNLLMRNGLRFTDLYFINIDTGWVCDFGPDPFGVGLQKTTNGGNSWFQQLASSYKPKKLFFLNKDTGWVITDDRKLYRTNNAGNNWTQIYNIGFTTYSIDFTTSDTGWIICDLGILKTINGGYNWIIQTDPGPGGSGPQNIFMINSNYGYIASAFYKILKTFDGINWGQQNAPQGGYNSLYFTDSLKGWSRHSLGILDVAATNDGGGPVTQITNNNEQIATGYKLFQNYPNPFNQFTIINYQCSIKCNVKLKVYDISGKEVATLVNALKQSGNYEVRFDGGNLGSGVYFYTLFSDNKKIDSKTMVIIK